MDTHSVDAISCTCQEPCNKDPSCQPVVASAHSSNWIPQASMHVKSAITILTNNTATSSLLDQSKLRDIHNELRLAQENIEALQKNFSSANERIEYLTKELTEVKEKHAIEVNTIKEKLLQQSEIMKQQQQEHKRVQELLKLDDDDASQQMEERMVRRQERVTATITESIQNSKSLNESREVLTSSVRYLSRIDSGVSVTSLTMSFDEQSDDSTSSHNVDPGYSSMPPSRESSSSNLHRNTSSNNTTLNPILEN